MEYEYHISKSEQIILNSLNRNIEVLKNLTQQKLFSVYSGRFLDTYHLEQNITLKEMEAVGYVVGLRDTSILDYAEAEEWFYQMNVAMRAFIETSDEENGEVNDSKLEAVDFFDEYFTWKDEVEEWMTCCFGYEVAEEVNDENEIA